MSFNKLMTSLCDVPSFGGRFLIWQLTWPMPALLVNQRPLKYLHQLVGGLARAFKMPQTTECENSLNLEGLDVYRFRYLRVGDFEVNHNEIVRSWEVKLTKNVSKGTICLNI